MKHATAETFASIGHLLQDLRNRKRLVERTPAAFYFKSKAFLHFHHDPSSPPATLTRRERRLALARRMYGDELPEAALSAFADWTDRT